MLLEIRLERVDICPDIDGKLLISLQSGQCWDRHTHFPAQSSKVVSNSVGHKQISGRSIQQVTRTMIKEVNQRRDKIIAKLLQRLGIDIIDIPAWPASCEIPCPDQTLSLTCCTLATPSSISSFFSEAALRGLGASKIRFSSSRVCPLVSTMMK